MTKSAKQASRDPEFEAYESVYRTLERLETSARARVIRYVLEKLDMGSIGTPSESDAPAAPVVAAQLPMAVPSSSTPKRPEAAEHEPNEDGLSPIARKWAQRNNLTVAGLSRVFSVGGEDVDLVAPTVPGNSKRARLQSVFLLRAVAAYLASGAARVTLPQLKEVISHYDADDESNFAANMKAIDTLYTGSKQSGYTLNARGLAEAAELIKKMLSEPETKGAGKK